LYKLYHISFSLLSIRLSCLLIYEIVQYDISILLISCAKEGGLETNGGYW